MDARRTSMCCAQHAAVHPVRDQRLWMHRALDVPALVVAVVKRLKIDIVRALERPHERRQIAEPSPCPRRPGRPSLDAIMIDPLVDTWQSHQIVEGEP